DERGNRTTERRSWTTTARTRKAAAPGASCCSVGFDTHELCGRPHVHARPARRSPNRVDNLELMLTKIERAATAQLSTVPDLVILTSALGFPVSVPSPSIFFTRSRPSTTSPKTTCLPSSQAVLTVVMKNWEPFVFAPAFAIDSRPSLVCL